MSQWLRLKNSDGRGRNGWFHAQEAAIALHTPSVILDERCPASLGIDIWSSRRGENAPIQLEMCIEDAVALANGILRASAARSATTSTAPELPTAETAVASSSPTSG